MATIAANAGSGPSGCGDNATVEVDNTPVQLQINDDTPIDGHNTAVAENTINYDVMTEKNDDMTEKKKSKKTKEQLQRQKQRQRGARQQARAAAQGEPEIITNAKASLIQLHARGVLGPHFFDVVNTDALQHSVGLIAVLTYTFLKGDFDGFHYVCEKPEEMYHIVITYKARVLNPFRVWVVRRIEALANRAGKGDEVVALGAEAVQYGRGAGTLVEAIHYFFHDIARKMHYKATGGPALPCTVCSPIQYTTNDGTWVVPVNGSTEYDHGQDKDRSWFTSLEKECAKGANIPYLILRPPEAIADYGTWVILTPRVPDHVVMEMGPICEDCCKLIPKQS